MRQYPRKVFDGGPTMAAPDLPEVLPDRPSDLDRLPIRRSQHGKMVTWRSIPHTHRPRRHAPGFVSREEPLSPELARAAAAGQWQASGLVYESQGDPATANVAYQAAYEERPTEDSAFDVGRSAEESGDMDQAMNAYASLLEAADMKSRSEKGLRP